MSPRQGGDAGDGADDEAHADKVAGGGRRASLSEHPPQAKTSLYAGAVREARYRLVWPKDLFLWEAARVQKLRDDQVVSATRHLLAEAFDDDAVADAFAAQFVDSDLGWMAPIRGAAARGWLTELMADESRLMPYVEPRYYAEREGHASAPGNPYEPLGVQFATLLVDMQEHGYFPKAMPRSCVDDWTDMGEVSERIRRAIHMPFDWDGNPLKGADWTQPVLYSLMEYFHDQAQRPRSAGYFHDYGGCGQHYENHSAESGGAVYRWRVNDLLERHHVGLSLGRFGHERGRLVHRFGTPLDDVADTRAAVGAHSPEDEVAHAIREFRERGASPTQKRAALALMAGALEARRAAVKTVLAKDESDLFHIANAFGVRHRNNQQRLDYGEEFLDYMFGAFLSALTLLEALERRGVLKT